MPFSTRSRTATRKPKRRRYKPTKRATGRDLNSLVRRVKKMIPKPEKKYFDVLTNITTASTPVSTSTAYLQPLDGITQGTGDTQRIGDQIWIQSMLMRISIQTGAAGINFLRMIVFRWKVGQGNVVPTAATILQVPNSYLSPINVDQGEQIKVMLDKTYALATGSSQLQIDKFWRRKRYLVNYAGNAGFTTPNSNSTYILFISDNAATANTPIISFYTRMRFTDC